MASILLPVPQILQNPELPNGCEITSCCEVLHYLGFAPDKCELAGGRRHEVLHTLHCMVLCGMDDQNFVVADPLDFNRVVPRVQFMKIYRQLGRRAVVIKKDS